MGALGQSAPHAPSSSALLVALALTAAAPVAYVSRRRGTGSAVGRRAGPVLFGSQGSRSPLVNWYLFEIGQDFEMVDVGATRVDRSAPEFPHPFGKIPALADGDLQVFESGAILMYLADKYGGLDTPEKRANANKWVVWANASLDPICFKEDGNGRVLDTGLRNDVPALATLDAHLEANEFLLGSGEESFSVADVAVGAYLLYVPLFFPDVTVSRWPNIQRYMLQLLQREAYQRAFGAGTAQQIETVETFARMKALEPRLFEDRYFKDIFRDLPKDWRYLLQRISWAEKRGIFTAQQPGHFAGQEDLLVPAVYHTPRPDTATICVGDSGRAPLTPGYEYDFLDLLYVKDQEGKVVQVVPWECCGISPAVFWTYSFKPPKGTTCLTPFAAFKLRGVWQGEAVEWDPDQGSEDMDWFTNMAPELRRELADPGLLEGKHKAEVENISSAKREKELPVLWPENSWQGNLAKAKVWDQLQM
ncbi:unnamed protein product [Effrenium voratum]|nr:unnamed protein product [Effrenium voratum]